LSGFVCDDDDRRQAKGLNFSGDGADDVGRILRTVQTGLVESPLEGV
jgi:hypothetical protein